MSWDNWFFGALMSFLVTGLIFCLVTRFYTYEYGSKCREQGGVPYKGVCMKVDTIKVMYQMKTQIQDDAQDLAQAKLDRDGYYLAMIKGDYATCASIEQKYGLYGYPPEVVSTALSALAQGMDADVAINEYIEGKR